MRLLNRLNQFQRLWQPSEGAPQAVTISELAVRCFCSERHMRTLLRQLEQHGWLRWRAQSGRGKRGELIFLVSPHTVRAGMMETVLSQGRRIMRWRSHNWRPGNCASYCIRFWAANGITTRRRCAFPTTARWSRSSPAFCPAAPSSISPGRSSAA